MREFVVPQGLVSCDLLQLAGHVEDGVAASDGEGEDEDMNEQAVVDEDDGPVAGALGRRG